MVYGKQSSRTYTAKVVKKVEDGYEVEFYKRKIPYNRFIRTNEEFAFIAYTDVVRALPMLCVHCQFLQKKRGLV